MRSNLPIPPSERLREFYARPDVKRVAEHYGDWTRSPQGEQTTMRLTLAAMGFLGGNITRKKYRSLIALEAKVTNLPLGDIQIMALTAVETFRAMWAAGQPHLSIRTK